jgi:predicted Zn-dependent peptidase
MFNDEELEQIRKVVCEELDEHGWKHIDPKTRAEQRWIENLANEHGW